MKLRALPLVLFFVALGIPLYAADVTVPDFELYTRGYLDGGAFNLATYGKMDIQIGGGYKFGGNIQLGFEGDNIGDIAALANTHLTFNGASVTIRNLFHAPLDLTYFTGLGDIFANGDAFPQYFGTAPIASRYRGYLYFPTGIQYDGIYTVAGTGVKLSAPSLAKWIDPMLYLYQDANLGTGYYASDLRVLLNFDHLKFEGFVGASFPYPTAGLYRAGALIYYNTGAGGSFLTEIGIPQWNPMTDPFDIKLFYLLFEPRIDFGSFAIIPTLFWHPYYYYYVDTTSVPITQGGPSVAVQKLEVLTNQVPTANINVDFRFGNPQKNPATGGFETELDYSTTTSSQFTALLSPYLRLVASGVIWNFKVNVKLYPFALSNIAEGFVGIQTQF